MLELIECSKMLLELLEGLKSKGQISEEEYKDHAKLKHELISYLEECTYKELTVSGGNPIPGFCSSGISPIESAVKTLP